VPAEENESAEPEVAGGGRSGAAASEEEKAPEQAKKKARTVTCRKGEDPANPCKFILCIQ
jgi:hypothetical protein